MTVQKTTIYLIRHGECTGNRERKIKGRTDFSLNETGILQANTLAETLKDKNLQHIYSSPLSRATDTAKIICKTLNVTYETHSEFNNICMGVWENRKKTDLAREVPRLWKIWMEEPEKLVLTNAETLDKVRKRTTEALNKIVKERAGQTVAIIGHRGILKPLLAGVLAVEKPYYWRFHIDNGSYSIITYDDNRGYTLVKLNYTDHLTGIPIIQEFD